MCFENLLQALQRADAVYVFVHSYMERVYSKKSAEASESDNLLDVATAQKSHSMGKALPAMSAEDNEVLYISVFSLLM